MQPTVTATLRDALTELEAEKATLDQQIAAIRLLLGEKKPSAPALRVVSGQPKRRTMSAAARKAISQRMREAWAKRRAAAKAKPKATPAK
jgi:hypothetical protein